jgi:hypothetical protein
MAIPHNRRAKMTIDFKKLAFENISDLSDDAIKSILGSVTMVDWTVWDHQDDDIGHSHSCAAACRRAGISKHTHSVVASYFSNDTFWNDYENKWEYCSTELYLVVPNELVSRHTTDFTYEDKALELGYSEY